MAAQAEHSEGRFTGAAGKQIYWQAWLPAGKPNGVAVIAHGYAEHSGRYTHVAELLAANGYATYAVDHHGHGKSEGPTANVNRMSEVITDLDRTIRMAAAKHPGQPVFLIGHSMGGLLALDYLARASTTSRYPLAGAVVSAAGVEISVGSPVEFALARVLSRVVPNLPVTPFGSAVLSRDPEVVAAYDNDPMVYRGRIKVRTGAEVLNTVDRVNAKLGDVELPLLVMHGGEDQVVQVAGSKRVAEQVSSDDVTLKIYDGLYHEIFNEPEKDVVLGDVVDWLKAHSR